VLFMQTVYSRPFLRLALAGALVAALGLAACGRKGDLDPPPGAASQVEEPAPRSGLASPVGISPLGGGGGGQSSSSADTNIGPDGQRLLKGPKRALPLDVLLN
jgi:predicted small lipoprotein YifL